MPPTNRLLTLAFAFYLICLSMGCTTRRLQKSITDQATTVADIQFQQVLDNLAAFSVNPHTLPSHVGVRDGSAQIQDAATGSVGLDILSSVTTSLGLQGSRTVVGQWGVSPITDDIELRLLKLAYQKASGFAIELDLDLANDVAHELGRQTAETADLDQTNAFSSFNSVRSRYLASAFDGEFWRTPADLNDTDKYREWIRRSLLADQIATSSLVSTNAKEIIRDYEDLNELHPFFYFQKDPLDKDKIIDNFYFTPLASYCRREVSDIKDDLSKINVGWFQTGCKGDIPRNACYIGHSRCCGQDRYAWVCEDGLQELSNFTIVVLKLSSLVKETSVVTIPGGGPRFSPSPPR